MLTLFYVLQKERQKDRQKMKEKKENQMPSAMLSNQEPAKKLTKLVLPEPQISDQVNNSVILFSM